MRGARLCALTQRPYSSRCVSHPLRYWFIYLTNWTLSVQCAYLTLAVYATWHAGQASAPAAPPRYLPALLYLQGVALPGSALVTLLFWTLVLPTWPEAATYTVRACTMRTHRLACAC